MSLFEIAFALQPVAMPRSIRTFGTLGHDALQPRLAAFAKELGATTADGFDQHQSLRLRATEQAAEFVLSFRNGRRRGS